MGKAGAGPAYVASENSGFFNRKNLFLKENKSDYHDYSVHFITKLNTDFIGSTNSLLIPGVEIRIEIVLNEPEFYLQSNTALSGVR